MEIFFYLNSKLNLTLNNLLSFFLQFRALADDDDEEEDDSEDEYEEMDRSNPYAVSVYSICFLRPTQSYAYHDLKLEFRALYSNNIAQRTSSCFNGIF